MGSSALPHASLPIPVTKTYTLAILHMITCYRPSEVLTTLPGHEYNGHECKEPHVLLSESVCHLQAGVAYEIVSLDEFVEHDIP